jgi:hypothetical protein
MTEKSPDQIIFEQWSVIAENTAAKLKKLIIEQSNKNHLFFWELISQFVDKMTHEFCSLYGYHGSLPNGDLDASFPFDKFAFNVFWLRGSWREELITKTEIQEFAERIDNSEQEDEEDRQNGQLYKPSFGIYITLSDFEQGLNSIYVTKGRKRIILMNGTEFLQWLMSYGIGVRTIQTYNIHEIDYNFIEHLMDDYERKVFTIE